MGFVAQKSALEDVGPMLFIALRFTLAALVVFPFAVFETRSAREAGTLCPFRWREWRQVVVLGLVFFLGMAFQQFGLLGTTVTNAGMLTGLYVVMVPLLLVVAWRTRQHPVIWPAAAISLGGIWLLGGGRIDGLNRADFLIIVCAFCWALHVILMGKAAQRIGRPVRIAAAQFALCGGLGLVGHCLGLFVGFDFEPSIANCDLVGATPEILYAAVVAGGFAFTLQAIAQRYTGEADAAVLLSSEALFAALGGALLLGDRLDWLGYVGCGLILAAIVGVSGVSGIAPQPTTKEPLQQGDG